MSVLLSFIIFVDSGERFIARRDGHRSNVQLANGQNLTKLQGNGNLE